MSSLRLRLHRLRSSLFSGRQDEGFCPLPGELTRFIISMKHEIIFISFHFSSLYIVAGCSINRDPRPSGIWQCFLSQGDQTSAGAA